MKSLAPANHHFLLEVSMEDLHKDVAIWLSDIKFWKVELSFFQKLLEKITVKTSSIEDKQKISHFQNLILYYRGEVLDQLKRDVHTHEVYLKSILEKDEAVNDQYYRETHQKLAGQLQSFEQAMKSYKSDLFKFAEQVL